jgi:hypothetical protein
VPRFAADVGVGVEESVEGGVIRAMPVPCRVADVGVGVKEILRRFDDDVGVGVEDNVVEVAEVEFAKRRGCGYLSLSQRLRERRHHLSPSPDGRHGFYLPKNQIQSSRKGWKRKSLLMHATWMTW